MHQWCQPHKEASIHWEPAHEGLVHKHGIIHQLPAALCSAQKGHTQAFCSHFPHWAADCFVEHSEWWHIAPICLDTRGVWSAAHACAHLLSLSTPMLGTSHQLIFSGYHHSQWCPAIRLIINNTQHGNIAPMLPVTHHQHQHCRIQCWGLRSGLFSSSLPITVIFDIIQPLDLSSTLANMATLLSCCSMMWHHCWYSTYSVYQWNPSHRYNITVKSTKTLQFRCISRKYSNLWCSQWEFQCEESQLWRKTIMTSKTKIDQYKLSWPQILYLQLFISS
jgi:hypothetical protein